MKNIFCILQGLTCKEAPFVYVDVGAMGGIPQKWQEINELLSVIAFEPDEREYKKLLQDTKMKVFNYAIHRESCPLTFYVTRESGKSSLLKPNKAFLQHFGNAERFDIIQEVQVPKEKVTSLDSLVAQGELSYIDFLKLDTQGSELDILKGAQANILPSLFGAQVEVEIAPMYEGQPLLDEVVTFMRQQGFELYDLRRAFWKRRSFCDYIGQGQLIFGDALFFKRPDIFIQRFKGGDHAFAQGAVIKAVIACLVYRAFDYAIALLDEARDQGVVTNDAYAHVRGLIIAFAKEGQIPQFWGKDFLYKCVNAAAALLKPPSYLGWADGDRSIANVKDR